MIPTFTLDTGALIAAEKGDRVFWRFWKRVVTRRLRVTLPAVVLAQVWRGNSPNVARMLKACVVETMGKEAAKRVGVLLASSRTIDVVDAAVVLGAVDRGDTVLTSDTGDIEHLVAAVGHRIRVLPV